MTLSPSAILTLKDSSNPIINWIDQELTDIFALKAERPLAEDILLELRQHFTDSEKKSRLAVLVGFYRILPKLEQKHYLLGFKIRQWFSFNYTLCISDPLERTAIQTNSLCLTMKSIDEVRKAYFTKNDYALPYHDTRVEVIENISL